MLVALRRTSREVAHALLDLVVPQACVGCDTSRTLLCPACAVTLGGPAFATQPDPCPVGFPPTWAVTPYAGAGRAALLAHKEHHRLGLVRPLGAALARSVGAAVADSSQPVVLVPVPSSRAATRRRGHDPVLRCARAAAYVLRLDGRAVAVQPVLTLGRVVADQSGLSAAGRAANLGGAHRVRPRPAERLRGLAGVRLVVVDDLVTTGASLVEATRALRAVGLPPAAAAVVAATARHPRLDRPGSTA